MKKLFLCSIFLSFTSSFVWAEPATNMQLIYNVDTQTLHIEANHPTDRLDRYFIRKVVVTKNSKETQDFQFFRQSRADKFIENLTYKAGPDDRLDVELFSSNGGTVKESLVILRTESNKKSDEKETLPNRK